jgi:hypothetical protein
METEKEEKTLEQIFDILASGGRSEIKEAKKTIEKIWRKDHKKFGKAKKLIFEIIRNFDSIKDAEHKSAVISGMSFFVLALADEHFDEFKNFIVANLQHNDGRVREAARKTGDWLYISLSDRAEPFVYPKGKPLTEKQLDEQKIAVKQYAGFVAELETLIERYDDENDSAEYVDEMKPSVNKSLQMVWHRLTESPVYRRISEQSRPIPVEIFTKRKEVESKIEDLLKKIGSNFSLDDIKQAVYEEDDSKCMMEIIAMFDKGQGINEFNKIMEIVNEAWNYFPHKMIDGLCPMEKMMEREEAQNGPNGLFRF